MEKASGMELVAVLDATWVIHTFFLLFARSCVQMVPNERQLVQTFPGMFALSPTCREHQVNHAKQKVAHIVLRGIFRTS